MPLCAGSQVCVQPGHNSHHVDGEAAAAGCSDGVTATLIYFRWKTLTVFHGSPEVCGFGPPSSASSVNRSTTDCATHETCVQRIEIEQFSLPRLSNLMTRITQVTNRN